MPDAKGQLNFTVTSSTGVFSITCTSTVITLNAQSNYTLPVTYTWTSPGGGVAYATSLTINAPGAYTVAASSGTVSSSQILAIVLNTIAPSLTLTAAHPSLTCLNRTITLTAQSSQTALSYAWKGASSSSLCSSYTCEASNHGSYSVTITDLTSGCKRSATVSIGSILFAPLYIYPANLFTIA
jgi:hypothetical protein